jgi:hypothetical protein
MGPTNTAGEAMSNRLQRSAELLKDVEFGKLSTHSRLVCAFDALYFCCCLEVAATIGEDVDSVEQPNSRIVGKGLEALDISAGTARRVFAFQDWVENFHLPYPEKCTPEQAAAIAGEVYRQTLAFLSSSERRT